MESDETITTQTQMFLLATQQMEIFSNEKKISIEEIEVDKYRNIDAKFKNRSTFFKPKNFKSLKTLAFNKKIHNKITEKSL